MKKIFFGLLIASFAVGGSIVTSSARTTNSKIVPIWFKFNGGDQNDPRNYTVFDGGMPTCCMGGVQLCAILAEPDPLDPSHPVIITQTDLVFRP